MAAIPKTLFMGRYNLDAQLLEKAIRSGEVVMTEVNGVEFCSFMEVNKSHELGKQEGSRLFLTGQEGKQLTDGACKEMSKVFDNINFSFAGCDSMHSSKPGSSSSGSRVALCDAGQESEEDTRLEFDVSVAESAKAAFDKLRRGAQKEMEKVTSPSDPNYVELRLGLIFIHTFTS